EWSSDVYSSDVHGFFVNVRLTKDEHIVVFHDEYVNRTMNLSGKVADFTLDELQQANAAYYFTEETDAINPSAHKEDSTKVVTLAQLLEAFPHHLICIEIKDSPDHTSELQSRFDLVCRLLLEKKKKHDPYVR